MSSEIGVVEMRRYTLHPGARDTLIELFEREFVEPQEALGMALLGRFRIEEFPDQFLWLRGFESMEARPEQLGAFYGGPVWKAHRDAANATMIDSDNVLLLRPLHLGNVAQSLFANSYFFDAPVTAKFIADIHARRLPVAASFTTEYAPNNFPALPVRENEHAFVWFGAQADPLADERLTLSSVSSPR